MIFKFCDESCSLHVNKNQFSDYHGGWSVYISYILYHTLDGVEVLMRGTPPCMRTDFRDIRE